MGSATVTETTLHHDTNGFHNRKHDNNTDAKETTRKIDVYDVLLPKNEGPWMRVVRRWEKRMGMRAPMRWVNVFAISLFHILGLGWFLYYCLAGRFPMWQTVAYSYFMGNVAGFGVTGGVHRYYSHRAFKAKWPLQLILLYCYSVAGQNTIYEWVRDHRVHHANSETTCDPHDVRRGFFFAHVGWLMMKKHPDVIAKGKALDMSDITEDPLVQFHTRHFIVIKLLCCFLLPTFIPLLWGESWQYCLVSQPVLRYMCSLHFTWSVNSFAHLWGHKPYDKHIMPSENAFVAFFAMGEGWHNYHHTFPWDYKAAELSYFINLTTLLIDFFARIGWAYDLKKASPCLVEAISSKRGPGQTGRPVKESGKEL